MPSTDFKRRYSGLGFAILLFLATVPSFAGEEQALVRFELALQSAASVAPAGRLLLRPLAGGTEPVVVPVEGGKPTEVRLPQYSLWEVSSELPGWWMKPATVTLAPGKAEHSQKLPVWRAATVAGSLLPPKESKAPLKEVTVAFGSLSRRLPQPGVPDGTANCPVAEDRSFRCTLPAARVDMALRVQGFVPHYRWGAGLEAGKTLALGRLALKPGASLAGRVETEEGLLEPGRGTARLLPLQAPGSGGFLAEKIQGTSSGAPVGIDGFFQLTDLRPGTYLLEVQHPGFAPARVRPVKIQAGLEARLTDTVVLKKPLQLELAVRPARDWLDRPWSVRASRFSEATGGLGPEPAFEGPVNQEGVAVMPGQTAGLYRITVSDSRGNGMFSDEIQITGPADARREVEIEVITVEGTLKLGKEPLAGSLAFGGERGAVSFFMEADAEGRFVGVLPREGIWHVDVKASEPRLETHTKVEVRADRLGRAEVEVALPDTRLFGRVLTEEGRPAPGAEVQVSTPLMAEWIHADEKGEFSFRALPAGSSQVAAEWRAAKDDRSTSDWAFVTLADGQEVGPIELRLRRVKPFSGRVESLGGPVAGATVRVTPERPLVGYGDQERTGLDGAFAAEIPGRTEVVQVVVAAPGMGLKAFEVDAADQPVVLFATEERGTLEIEIPFSSEQAAARDLLIVVFQNGLALGLPDLRRWAQAHGMQVLLKESRFAFPALAPGSYRACAAPDAAIADWAMAGWPESGAACASGTLVDGGTLRLRIPGEMPAAAEAGLQEERR